MNIDLSPYRREIVRLMRARGWTAYRLAKETGQSKSTICRFLRGRAVRIDTLEAWRRALGAKA